MTGFHYEGGELCVEGIALSAIAERFGTPSYVYSSAAKPMFVAQHKTKVRPKEVTMRCINAVLSGKRLAEMEPQPVAYRVLYSHRSM